MPRLQENKKITKNQFIKVYFKNVRNTQIEMSSNRRVKEKV